MLRSSIALVGIILSSATITAHAGQNALPNLRDIVVPYKSCSSAKLPKDVDPTGIINKEILRPSQREILRRWEPLIPDSARPPSNKKGQAVIELKLTMDGKVGFLRLLSHSGDEALDKSAWGAITSSSFKPFPPEAKARSVTFTIAFTVNQTCTE